MSEVLTPGVPATIADLFESHQVTWTKGWGDYTQRTCLHGALLRPCAVVGDEILWSVLLSYRGLSIRWNDEQMSEVAVIGRLREQSDPDVAEMVKVSGPNWEAARQVARMWGAATEEQKQDARAAWDAWDAQDAWDARDARAARDAWAARDARAAWDAWDARAVRAALAAWDAWAARDALAARAARAAFFATVAHPWIDESTDWTRARYEVAVGPWVSVFGKIDNIDPEGDMS